MSSYAIMTNLGRNKEAANIASATALTITEIAWGDGTRIPAGGETTLENEQGRKAINGNGVLAEALNTAFFEIALSAAEGPFVIREAGLFDTDGDMIAIARFDPPVNKPQNSVTALIRMNVVFSDLENLVLTVEQDNTFVPAIPRQEAIAGNDVLSADLLTLFDVSADTQKKVGVEALAIRMRDLARNGPLLAVPVADNAALDAVVTSSILTAAQGALQPPLAIGGTIEHIELSDGSAIQKALRIAPTGVFLTKHIRTRRNNAWSGWTADGPDIGDLVIQTHDGDLLDRFEAAGADLSRASYADLFYRTGTIYGAGDGATTFGTLDVRGEGLRGWDNGRGVDVGRVLGSWQDASRVVGMGGSGGVAGIYGANWHLHHSNQYVAHNLEETGASGAASGGLGSYYHAVTGPTPHAYSFTHGKMRGRNVALKFCVKF